MASTQQQAELLLSGDVAEIASRYGQAMADARQVRAVEGQVEEVAEEFISRQEEDVVGGLDYTDESLLTLDEIVAGELDSIDIDPDAYEEPDLEALEPMVVDLGSYLAKTIKENLGGEWRFRQELTHTSIAFPRLGLEVFPYHVAQRRITESAEFSLFDFYEQLVEKLVGD